MAVVFQGCRVPSSCARSLWRTFFSSVLPTSSYIPPTCTSHPGSFHQPPRLRARRLYFFLVLFVGGASCFMQKGACHTRRVLHIPGNIHIRSSNVIHGFTRLKLLSPLGHASIRQGYAHLWLVHLLCELEHKLFSRFAGEVSTTPPWF